MSMTRLWELSRSLAAFAFKDQVVEYLDKHLVEVAVEAFELLKRKSFSLAFIGSLAALLHDIGKSLSIYQSCLISHENVCSYVAHEVFSAVIINKLFEIFPNLIPDKVLNELCKDFGIDRGDVVKMVMIPVLLHHQAMGDPLERLDRFIKKYGDRIEISKELVHTMREAVEEFSNRTGVELGMKLSENHVNELEKAVNHFVKTCRKLEALEIFRPPRDPDYSRKTLAKLITGVLIICDLRVAKRNRPSTPLPIYDNPA